MQKENNICIIYQPSASVFVDHNFWCFSLNDQILKERFGMVAPDVQIEDGKGTILISSEEGETEGKEEVTVK